MRPQSILLALSLSAVASLAAPVTPCKVIAKLPHSTANYTEGFFYRDGHFYEGTGREGHSSIIVTEPSTGHIFQQHDLRPQYFGEGIIDWQDKLFEWTWQTHIGFIYDRASLRIIGQFHYDGEGWGMTHTATELITSDGSAILRFRSPDTFDVKRQITVRDNGEFIRNLNELEYINGEIYANIWHSDRIARISPTDGHVMAWLDCTGLLPASQKIDDESVLNGIAYDEQHRRVYVTGKQWPSIFQIELPPSK
jgi:glutaminyl-peptide cyclotransferase